MTVEYHDLLDADGYSALLFSDDADVMAEIHDWLVRFGIGIEFIWDKDGPIEGIQTDCITDRILAILLKLTWG